MGIFGEICKIADVKRDWVRFTRPLFFLGYCGTVSTKWRKL